MARGTLDGVTQTESPSLTSPRDERARIVAFTFIPAGTRVLDIGAGDMALERFLPFGCTYLPCDAEPRDARTQRVDISAGEMPGFEGADLITVLGALEHVRDVPGFFSRLRQANLPVVVTYASVDLAPDLDRAAMGWVNHLSTEQLLVSALQAGFHAHVGTRLDDTQVVLSLRPQPQPQVQERRVLVVAQGHGAGARGGVESLDARLGFRALQSVLPAHASLSCIEAGDAVPEGDFHLAVLGLGGALTQGEARDVLPYLAAAPRTVGVFGAPVTPDPDFGALLDGLTVWLARSDSDVQRFAAGRQNVVPVGPWALDGLCMGAGALETPFDADAWLVANAGQAVPVDRFIDALQSHASVASTRLHALLCAAVSARRLCFPEGRASDEAFVAADAVMRDVIGRPLVRGEWVEVDRDAVVACKRKLRTLLGETRKLVEVLLG